MTFALLHGFTGDCDVDDDCLDELVCKQRGYDEPIPSCQGIPLNSVDYCVKPPVIMAPTTAPMDMNTMSPTEAMTMADTEMLVALQIVGDNNELPLGLCQGTRHPVNPICCI